jgi:competence protein ComEA
VTNGDRIAAAALSVALLAVGLGAWLVLGGGLAPGPSGAGVADPFATAAQSSAPTATSRLVVDVEGAVLHPGILELPPGSRVADAVAAAGGYSERADLQAAAAQVNLAALVRDGQQIMVPATGGPAASGASGGGGASGLVDLNSASPDALDALPGIGPVTVQKIVAARTDKPFGTLQELITRKVLTSGQLDKIRDLVTLG